MRIVKSNRPIGRPVWLSWWRIRLQCGRPGFDPWVGKMPWRRERLPTPVFWPGEFRRLQSMGSQRLGHNWATCTFPFFFSGSQVCSLDQRHQYHLSNLLEVQILGPQLDLLNQKLWEWGQEICVPTNLPRDSDAEWGALQQRSAHLSSSAVRCFQQQLPSPHDTTSLETHATQRTPHCPSLLAWCSKPQVTSLRF